MTLLFAIVQFFIPRTKEIWLYVEGQQRSCSHFLVQSKGIDSRRHIYLSNNNTQLENLRRLGIECYAANSLKAKWLAVRSGVWVFCTSWPEELDRRLSDGAKIFNIWHGIPFKAIGLENYNPENWKKSDFKRVRNIRRQSRKYEDVNFLCATSPLSQALFAKSFGKSLNEVPIVGEPRNDYLINNMGDRTNLIKRYGPAFSSASMVFVYMPTFRDYGHWDNGLNLARLNTFLADNNALLLIRSHPIDQSIKDIDPAFSRIIKSTPVPGSWDDAYEELVGSDVLITDYSSLLFEYLLVDQPILLYHPDREKYENSRHFGVDFEQIKPSESITEFDELLKAMEKCLSGSFDKTLLKKSKQLIHSLTDDASSQRVYDAICERI